MSNAKSITPADSLEKKLYIFAYLNIQNCPQIKNIRAILFSCIFIIISAIFIWKRGRAKSPDSALYENEAGAFSANQNAGLQKSFILPLLDLHRWFCTVILHYTTPWFAPANQDNSTIKTLIYILQLEGQWLMQITTLTQCKIIFIYTCCSYKNTSIICLCLFTNNHVVWGKLTIASYFFYSGDSTMKLSHMKKLI